MAEKTGWPEAFLVWSLPLARLLRYQHAALWMAGAWTTRPGVAVETLADAALAHIRALPVDDDE